MRVYFMTNRNQREAMPFPEFGFTPTADVTVGHAKMADNSLVSESLQDVQRTAGRHRRCKGGPFLIVEIHDLDAVDTEKFQ